MKALGQHDIKSVVITGCNRGIGLAMLKHFVENSDPDTQIFSCSRRSSPELEELGKKDNVHLITMDITNKESVESAVAEVTKLLNGKGLNLLINNAARASQDVFAKVVDTTTEELNDIYNINVTSNHLVTVSFYPLLKLSGTSNTDLPMCAARGLICNFSSITASVELAPPFGQFNILVYSYALTKCAINMMTKMCAHEFKPDGVLCVAVHPGWVKSDMGALGGDMGTGDITTDEAAGHMIDIMTGATEEHTGLYLAKDLKRLPF